MESTARKPPSGIERRMFTVGFRQYARHGKVNYAALAQALHLPTWEKARSLWRGLCERWPVVDALCETAAELWPANTDNTGSTGNGVLRCLIWTAYAGRLPLVAERMGVSERAVRKLLTRACELYRGAAELQSQARHFGRSEKERTITDALRCNPQTPLSTIIDLCLEPIGLRKGVPYRHAPIASRPRQSRYPRPEQIAGSHLEGRCWYCRRQGNFTVEEGFCPCGFGYGSGEIEEKDGKLDILSSAQKGS